MSQLLNIISANRAKSVDLHNSQQQIGIYAICSAHPLVLEAAILQAKQDQSPLLIEATANQVNQYGGYTNMQAHQFKQFVFDLADKLDFNRDNIILGGDHLGPVVWQHLEATLAYEKAEQLIGSYIKAGFSKIHLDCSMPCLNDPVPLPDELIAQRAARLCQVAEQTAAEHFDRNDCVYVIGTEVPPPGGASDTIESLEVTDIQSAKQTVLAHQQAFAQHELSHVWPRVVALVVQPGVEFDNFSVIDYQSDKAQQLKALISQTEHLVFEAHSTDYQNPNAYQQLVDDHFAILKVGPQLTYAMREAIFALCDIESQLIAIEQRSNLKAVIEQQMIENPSYWQSFYHAEAQQLPVYRQYSYSDRIRYYWPNKHIKHALSILLDNLNQIDIPLPLISQYLPQHYQAIRYGQLSGDPHSLIIANIRQVTQIYANACSNAKIKTKTSQDTI